MSGLIFPAHLVDHTRVSYLGSGLRKENRDSVLAGFQHAPNYYIWGGRDLVELKYGNVLTNFPRRRVAPLT